MRRLPECCCKIVSIRYINRRIQGVAMTEAEWENADEPQALLAFLGSNTKYARKLRLFAAACSRRAWDEIDELGRAAVVVAESFADGVLGPVELRAARLACKGAGSQAAWYAAATNPAIAARNAARSAQSRAASEKAELLAQADLLRDIFGPLPFRAVLLDAFTKYDGAMVRSAQGIYEERNGDGTLDHSRLRELAQMLEDAGGGNAALVRHCRGAGPHVRGCWVIDLLLTRD
jgi:hypothetical protein